MRRLGGAVAALVLAGLASSALADPYATDRTVTGEDRIMSDVIFGRPGAIERLRQRLTTAPAASPALQKEGWSTLCEHSYHVGQYAQGAKDCAEAVLRDSDVNTAVIVRLLAAQPVPRAEGSARVALSAGAHVPVAAGDYRDFAIADTGAQISVMMESVALAAHVRILGASSSVDTTTTPVRGKIGIVPEVRIGGAVLRDLPVLVLPDHQLSIAGGRVRLPFILSLYALAEFGRVAWLDHGRVLALGDAAPAPTADAVPMIWHPQGIAVPLDGRIGRRAAHLDSGANLSYLFNAGLPMLRAEEVQRLAPSHRRVGGVGGVVDEQGDQLPLATLSMAGRPLVLTDVDVVRDTENGEVARIGEDVLNRYAAAVLDFRTMTFSLKP